MSVKHPRLLITVLLTATVLLGAAAANLQGGSVKSVQSTSASAVVLPVETRVVSLQQGYDLERRFSGQVQARRQTELGFERGGRLSQVMIDEGDHVVAGQLLAELDTQRLKAQRAELNAARAEAEARLALAKITLQRFQGVIDKGGVSRQGLDEARETERAARAALSLAVQRIATVEVELNKTRLTAPFAATVISRSADEGQVLETGQPVLTLLEQSNPEIRIGIAGRTLPYLKAGDIYAIDWRGQSVDARLRALLPLRAATARTVEALFDPIDPPSTMIPGDMVTITLQKRIPAEGFWVPLGALNEGERGLWSLYVTERLEQAATNTTATHRIARRSVEILNQSANNVFVKTSLAPGEQIVVGGTHRIVPGQAVRLKTGPLTRVEQTQ